MNKTQLKVGCRRNSLETSEGEELGKFYSQKETGGNIRCITEQNFKMKLQFECGTGIMSRYFAIECDKRNILILLILNTSIPQKVDEIYFRTSESTRW